MSSLSKVLECEDLRGILRAYWQCHPVAMLIKNEYVDRYDCVSLNRCTIFEIFSMGNGYLSKMKLSIMIKDHLEKISKKSNYEFKMYYSEYKEEEYEIYNSFRKNVIEDYDKIYKCLYELSNFRCICDSCYEDESESESESEDDY